MKKNTSLFGFLIAILAVAVSFGFYYLFLEKKNYFLVDNPTSNTYYFKINNGDEKIITSGQSVKVNLNTGENHIKVFDEKKSPLFDSSFVVKKTRGLLNIAHQDYYINRQYYGHITNKDSLLLLNKVMIDGTPYMGDLKHVNRLYCEDFYFNIDEDYNRLIKSIDKVESRTKIFRKQDFINYYKEYYKF